MLNAMHNVAIYFMTFVSEHYMMLSPNRGFYRNDEKVKMQIVGKLPINRNQNIQKMKDSERIKIIWMKINVVLCDVSDI